MSDQFYFEPLNALNLEHWKKVAAHCRYAPLNILDDYYINTLIAEKRSEGNCIIFHAKTRTPVALLPAETLTQKIGPVKLKTLRSWFGGLMIEDSSFPEALLIKDYAFKKIIRGYYKKTLKADYLDLALPPKIIIENPSEIYSLTPFYQASVNINSLLYTRLAPGLLETFKYNVKREITLGMKNLETCTLTGREDARVFEYIKALEKEKADFLNIKPFAQDYLQRISLSAMFHPIVAVANDKPIAAVVYTLSNGVGTYNYNASTPQGKKMFINKALLYQAMMQCQHKGAGLFILGHGWEYSHVESVNMQLAKVAFFKRSVASHEASFYGFTYPLSRKGNLAVAYKQVRSSALNC